MMKNPFITYGYEGPEYFCDRVAETKSLSTLLMNGNNVVLMSPRRIGKTGLLMHTFAQDEIANGYNTFMIDIYATNCFHDFVSAVGKAILSTLMSHGEKAIAQFIQIVSSLRPVMTFDISGNPSWSIESAHSVEPHYTLEQISRYLDEADRPNIIAIDEFQQIIFYPEKNIEAVLRTFIQKCRNTTWVFSGSSRHILSEMFASPARPFYASTSTLSLECLPLESYADFSRQQFERYGKQLDRDVPALVYERFEGITWFMQRIMNKLFSMTGKGEKCDVEMVDTAIGSIIDDCSGIYGDLLYQLTGRQRELLIAISRERKATGITGEEFIRKYGLHSPSTVQTTVKALLDRQIITMDKGIYEVYDKFFSIWLETHM